MQHEAGLRSYCFKGDELVLQRHPQQSPEWLVFMHVMRPALLPMPIRCRVAKFLHLSS